MTFDAVVFSGLAGASAVFATALLPLEKGFWAGLSGFALNLGLLIVTYFQSDSAAIVLWQQSTASGFMMGALWTVIGRIVTKDIPR